MNPPDSFHGTPQRRSALGGMNHYVNCISTISNTQLFGESTLNETTAVHLASAVRAKVTVLLFFGHNFMPLWITSSLPLPKSAKKGNDEFLSVAAQNQTNA